MKIPKSFKMYGHNIKVILEDDLHKNRDLWGECRFRRGEIAIDSKIKNDLKQQTFLHEVVHLILDYMRELELSENEKFVNTFSELLYQFIETSEY